MQIRTYNPYKSIVETPTNDELPGFTLITGANGAGKTHLLEAMKEGMTQIDGGYGGRRARMLGTADLQAVDHLATVPQTREQKVSQFQDQVAQRRLNTRGRPDERQLIQQFILENGLLTPTSLSAAELAAGQPIEHWTASDFARYTPREIGRLDLFTVMIADVFQSYAHLHTLNGYNRWRSEVFGDDLHWMEDAAFESIHGVPPWDLLNSVLADVGFRYRYDTPERWTLPPYPLPGLTDLDVGTRVPPGELSSGERTLLTIALAAYSVNSRRDAVEMPAIILLDEPDAALHPSMVQSLLNLVEREIVGKLGIPAIMTTHSPTTVALAHEDSIHLMARNESPRLRKATKDAALKTLLVGVPALSVRAENRRTVIVESPIDERIYTRAVSLLAPRLLSERSLHFMAAGSKELANGCDAVVNLVSRLRENGNDSVWGLVDRDHRGSEPHASVFFDASRHSLENLMLDPLPLGLLLLRDGEQGAVEAFRSTNYVSFGPAQAAELVAWLTAQIIGDGDDSSPRAVTYATGLNLSIDSFWTEMRGHNLADRVMERFPALKSHRGLLFDDIVQFVWAEHPWAIPQTALDTFARLLDA